MEKLEGQGALNFLSMDDMNISQEGEFVDPKSIIREKDLNEFGLKSDELSEKEVLKDCVVTTMTSGGKGGQNVNKVETGVRIIHSPTNINVKCTQQRTQPQNRKIALSILMGKLLTLMKEQKVDKMNAINGKLVDKGWGNQIRNYVLQPEQRIKDLRSGWMLNSNANSVLDGEEGLFDCMESVWEYNLEKELRGGE